MDKPSQSYLKYVKLGKEILSKVDCYQVQIAHYATLICQIRHGGRSGQLYTVSDYARDIGMNNKTLLTWVQIYRNIVLKLDIERDKISAKDWAVASRVNNLLARDRIINNKNAGTPGGKEFYKKDFPKKRIKDLFGQNYNSPSVQMNVLEWKDYMTTVKNKLLSRDFSNVSVSSLTALKEEMDKASDACMVQINKKFQGASIALRKGMDVVQLSQ